IYAPLQRTPLHYFPTRRSSDLNEVVEAALNSKTGSRFNSFLNGGWEKLYSSQSEADMAFANDLAFWTAGDFSKMETIFMSSDLRSEEHTSELQSRFDLVCRLLL